MDLKCYVNGKEYKNKMVQGIVVSEEYNETLDSATVILSQVPKINDLRPYDDFFIYEGEFKGYNKKELYYKELEYSENKNNFSFFIFQNINGDFSANISLNLKISFSNEISNFYIEFISHKKTGNATYLCNYYEATEEYPPAIVFKKQNGSDNFPSEFSLVQVSDDDGEKVFYGNFDSDCTFDSIKNLKIDNKYILFHFYIYEKEYRDYVGNYELSKISSFQNVILPDNFSYTENFEAKSSRLRFKTIYIKKGQEEVAENEFVNTYEIVKVETFSSDYDIIIPSEDMFTLKPNALSGLGRNMVLLFGKDNENSNNYFSTFSLKKEYSNEEYDFSYTILDEIEYIYVPDRKETIEYNGFYKHFLVDQYVEEMLNLDENPEKILYKYKIELFSETKKLETIQIPNFSVTQPQHGGEKKSVYSYIVDVVNMYNPTYKTSIDRNDKKWTYNKKYSVDESLKGIFENLYCPDFTLNNPNLRDVLAQLMVVADMIPYVEDDIIKAMDITKRTGNFDRNIGEITNIVGSRTSSNHCDNLKRTYSNALSQENTAHSIEYVGFRNSSSSMLTLENLKLETRFPIYKINKMYMCYYKKARVVSKISWESGISYPYGQKVTKDNVMIVCIKTGGSSTEFIAEEWGVLNKDKIFLCKQDITKLILLEQERNLISQDWTELIDKKDSFTSVDEMATYKFCTLGYSIGSNEINGFGTKYDYFESYRWDKTATYIQNILGIMDRIYPYGIYAEEYFELEEGETLSGIPIESFDIDENFIKQYFNYFKKLSVFPFDNAALGLKSLVFQIDYNAFYNGTIYHSKDTDRDDIVINDNSSSSLTLLEQDGIHQKEKANRFSNKTMQISARYKNINELQKLGTVYNYDDEEDIIIYHRQYSIFDNLITCSYTGSKDYVLKNYFTSVYAKHRPYNLMSYGESVRRSENRKMYMMLSRDNAYTENENEKFEIKSFDQGSFIENIFSFFKPDEYTNKKNDLKKRHKINYGYYSYGDSYFASDINSFNSGNSICFNVAMYDNVSAGLYLDKNQLEPDMDWNSSLGLVGKDEKDNTISINLTDDQKTYIRGSKQKWYLTVDDAKTGHAEIMGFYIGHKDDEKFSKKLYNCDETSINQIKENIIKDEFFAYPKIKNVNDITNVIGKNYLLNKDNKEIIDMTFQIEIMKDIKDNNLFFSDWMLKLSDLIAVNNKFDSDEKSSFFIDINQKNEIFAFSTEVRGNTVINPSGSKLRLRAYVPTVILSIDNKVGIKVNDTLGDFSFKTTKIAVVNYPGSSNMKYYQLDLKNVSKIEEDYITVLANQYVTIGNETFTNENIEVLFKKIKSFGINSVPENKTWYCNYLIENLNDVPKNWWDKFIDSVAGIDMRGLDSNVAKLADGSTKILVGNSEINIADIIVASDYIINDPFKQLINRYNTKNVVIKDDKSNDFIVYNKNLFLTTSKRCLKNTDLYKTGC